MFSKPTPALLYFSLEVINFSTFSPACCLIKDKSILSHSFVNLPIKAFSALVGSRQESLGFFSEEYMLLDLMPRAL